MKVLTKSPLSLFGSLSLGFLLSSCSVGPDYEKAQLVIPNLYKEGTSQEWKKATPQEAAHQGQWWTLFKDPLLNDLEEKATQANQTIKVAQAHYQQALALVDEVKGGLFPTVSAVGNVSKSRSPSSSNSQNSSSQKSGNASIALQANWEVDLWGSVQRVLEAEEAAAEASQADLAAVRLSIQATVAQTYFQLRALDALQKVLDESVEAYERFLKLTKNQYEAGIASKLAILQADTQLQTMKVMALENGVARAQYEHALAVLIDQPPSYFSLSQSGIAGEIPDIPIGIPSDLLERRPDIAQAERLMAQANAQIGVAASAFFPVLTLTGSRGYAQKDLGRLISAPAVAWSLGSQLIEEIFDGGSRAAAVEAAGANYHATVATYRQTVLTAFQEVEDTLSTLRILKQESAVQNQASEAAKKQLAFTMNQYKEGTLSSLDALTALFNFYTSQKEAIILRGRQMVASVALIKALG